MLDVGLVSIGAVHEWWDQAEPYIEDSCREANTDLTPLEIKIKVLSGEWTLIVVFDEDTHRIEGAVVVHVYNRLTERVAFITAIGGKFITNGYSFERLRALLKDMGATCIEGNVRDSVLKLLGRLGFVKKSTTITYTL